jgi:hypothetical protein
MTGGRYRAQVVVKSSSAFAPLPLKAREHVARQAAEREQRFKEQQERERAADEQRRIKRNRTLSWPV